ncbi:SPOR domain-containing protein [Sphingomonas sp.]|uniref:SPOR domain-containing protein n=1 Tax=Sphingomonas sp. TaxID=28214 RepID=UPI003CC6CA8A
MRPLLLSAAALLIAAPAFADVRAGVEAWQRGDYRQAIEQWRGPAVAGDADAQFNLGQAYKLGRGVPVDPQMAESWFRKAALQGHEQAQDNYGLALFQSGRKQEAVPWLERSVARDEARTELVYGTMLFNGDGVPRDYPRAYALMTRAAAPRPATAAGPATNGLQSARETLAQMDGYVSPADRERGVALAQQIALGAQARPGAAPGRNQVVDQSLGVRYPGTPVPIEPMSLPPSQVEQPAPHVTPAPLGTRTPAAAHANPGPAPAPPRPALAHSAPVPPPVQAASPPRPAPATGGYRIQLGAFRDRGNAEALWTRLHGKLAGGQPSYVAGGGVTRLQVTGFSTRAAAQAACTRAGGGCIVVAP